MAIGSRDFAIKIGFDGAELERGVAKNRELMERLRQETAQLTAELGKLRSAAGAQGGSSRQQAADAGQAAAAFERQARAVSARADAERQGAQAAAAAAGAQRQVAQQAQATATATERLVGASEAKARADAALAGLAGRLVSAQQASAGAVLQGAEATERYSRAVELRLRADAALVGIQARSAAAQSAARGETLSTAEAAERLSRASAQQAASEAQAANARIALAARLGEAQRQGAQAQQVATAQSAQAAAVADRAAAAQARLGATEDRAASLRLAAANIVAQASERTAQAQARASVGAQAAVAASERIAAAASQQAVSEDRLAALRLASANIAAQANSRVATAFAQAQQPIASVADATKRAAEQTRAAAEQSDRMASAADRQAAAHKRVSDALHAYNPLRDMRGAQGVFEPEAPPRGGGGGGGGGGRGFNPEQADRQSAAFLANLQREADAIGRTRSEYLELQAAKMGLTAQAAPMIQRLRQAEQGMVGMRRSTALNRQELLTLQYTVNDVAASLGSGISPLTILLQQGPQVIDGFGGINNAFTKILAQFNPFRIAVIAATAVVGGLTVALYKGASEASGLQRELTLSGNAAGLTQGKFNALAKSVAASSTATVGAAREAARELAKSGQINPGNFDAATEAVSRYASVTGQTAKAVAQQFAGMSADVTRWATEFNRSTNFLTAAQIDQIRTLQEQGREVEAQAVVYNALNQRLRDTETTLGTLDRTLVVVKKAWSSFWDAAFDVGRPATIEDKLAGAQERAEYLADRLARGRGGRNTDAASGAARNEVAYQSELLRIQRRAAEAAGERARTEKEAIAALDEVRGWQRQAKSAEALNRELARAQANFDKLARAGLAVPAGDQKAILADIRRRYEPSTGRSGSGNRDADRLLKADLAASLKLIDAEFDAARRRQDDFVQDTRNAYDLGLTSAREFFEQRRALAEQIALIEDSTAQRTEAALRAAAARAVRPDTRAEIEGRLAEAVAKREIGQERASRAAVLLAREEAAAYRQVQEQILDLTAALATSRGDDLAAAQRDIERQVQQAARTLAAAGRGPEQAIELRGALQNNAALAELQRQQQAITAAAVAAEQAYTDAAVARGESLEQVEQGVINIRQQALQQLQALATAAAQLAQVSTDPRVGAFAAGLAAQVAQAADAIDPAVQRMRGAAQTVAGAFANATGEIISNVSNAGSAVRKLAEELRDVVLKETITEPLRRGIETALRSADGPLGGMFAKLFALSPEKMSADALATNAAQARAAADTAAKLAADALATAAASAARALAAIGAQGPSSGGGDILGKIVGLFGSGGTGTATDQFHLALPPGWQGGGFTGHGSPGEVAGPVHREEFVFSAPAVRAIGLDRLERMHKAARGGAASSGMRGWADGGYTGPRTLPSMGAAAMAHAGPPAAAEVVLNFHGGERPKEVRQRRDGNRLQLDLMYEAVAGRLQDDFAAGGPVGRSIDNTRGTRRAAMLTR